LLKVYDPIYKPKCSSFGTHQGIDIQGFPTLKMFVNNDKDEVLDYEGPRDFDAIKV
jgi:hypothetical protein